MVERQFGLWSLTVAIGVGLAGTAIAIRWPTARVLGVSLLAVAILPLVILVVRAVRRSRGVGEPPVLPLAIVRPQILVQFDVPFLWDKRLVQLGAEQPFVVTNSGQPARNVVIGPINLGNRHRAVFDEISSVLEHQSVEIRPYIEQDGQLRGGIFQRDLVATLQAFVDQRWREGAKYLALPFLGTYRDFEGRKYTTVFELQISGPMMRQVCVERTADETG
jgi:hypothetical protein